MSIGKQPPTGGSLTMPSQDYELKRQEQEIMLGKDITLHVSLPNGEPPIEIAVKESNEVGYIKLLLAQKYGLDANKIQLFFNKTPLIDPMSLCDHSGIRPPYVELELRLVS